MDFLLNIGNSINSVMGIFGSSIIVPVIIFIISLIMKTSVKKSFQGALYMGVGLTMFNVLLGALLGGIAPYVIAMAQNTGITLPFVDVGWQGAAVIVYSNQLGYMYLALGLGVNLLLFITKYTDTFQPTDIWNYYQFVFWAIIVQFVTGSLAMGIFAAMFMNLVVLFIADVIGPSLQEYYGYEGVTLTSVPSAAAPFAILVRWLLIKLKLDKKEMSVEGLSNKLGFWGEPIAIGLIVGLFITILGSLNGLGEIGTWSGMIKTVLVVSGTMIIYPAVSGMFVKGLIPLSQSMNDSIRSGKLKRDKIFIAMDPAIFFGDSSNIAAAMIMIPIVFGISLVLPGNKILMLADIPAMPFMTIAFITIFKGNVLYTIISGTIWYSFANILNSDVSASFTQAAMSSGVGESLTSVAESFAQGLSVASWTVGSNPILWVVYKAFSASGSMRYVGIALCIAVYGVLYYNFKKNKRKWYIAAGASENFLDEMEIAVNS